MARKVNYAELFTLRSDGRYQTSYTDSSGRRKYLYDKDPKRLYEKLQNAEQPPAVRFSALAEAWKDEHEQQIGYKAAEAYHAPLRRICAAFGEDLPADVTAPRIQAFLSDLGAQDYARRSVQMHRDVLNMIYNYAIRHRYVETNPVASVVMPRNLRTGKRTVPDDAAIDAVKAGGSAPFGLFALVCLYAGLRRGEALALRYEDIDRDARTITVDKAVEFVDNTPRIKSTKTESGTRTVILLDALAAQLPDGTGYIFSDQGKLLTKMQYRRRWIMYQKAIGYDITAHQLRHGYATILYEAGIGDKDAQELLGHASITTTRQIYTHIRQQHRNDVADKLNRFVMSPDDVKKQQSIDIA